MTLDSRRKESLNTRNINQKKRQQCQHILERYKKRKAWKNNREKNEGQIIK